ncbi:uncharacterized protein LOC135078799 [Ostrinia nubilalis]|uniref:uncharacterized protein LOC135078799 n=1 Tax=Ostrinia nubilalis TaxID=29057 RepID=UPI0030824E97
MIMKVIFVCVCVVGALGKVTPDYFPQCKRSDPQIEKCVLDAIEAIKPRLKTGIPEVNVPALDPFTVPTLRLDKTAPNLRLKATVKHAKAFGGTNFVIEKLRLNLNNKYAAEIKIVLPKLAVIADYDVRGSRLLTLDISGKGKLRGNFTGITVVAKGIGKPVEKDGVEYLQAEKVVTRVKINHGQVAFDDTERPVAAASAATFFNASPGVVLDILNPLIEETSAAVIKAFVNKILGAIPINEVLVDWKPTPCHYSDPNVAECIQRMAEQARHLLAQGVPSLNIQALEPLKVPSIRLRQHNMPKNKFKYDAWLSDIMLRGLTNYTFNNLECIYISLHCSSKLHELRMKGNYKLSGKLLMLPIEGEGKFSAKYGDIDALVTIVLGRKHQPNHFDTLTCEDLDVKFHMGYASMELENLFGGDNELGNSMNKFLNENWQKLAGELQAPMEEALHDFLRPLADHAFATLNADDILSS